MTLIFEYVRILWLQVLSLHWLLAGVANTLVLVLIGRVLLYGYREHSYLYQFEDRGRAKDNWVKALVPLAKHVKLQGYREALAIRLSRAGTRRDWDVNHFIASQILIAIVTAVVVFAFGVMLMGVGISWLLALVLLSLLLPYLKLSDLAACRFKAVNRDLSYFIDYLALAMGAGLDFNQAMMVVVADAPKSPLSDEFALILRNMRLGMSKAEALNEMERRLASPPLKLFVQTLVQGMELGSDVVLTLNVMSENLQQKRFQRAEESAGKISVKMMIPMMCFLMPAVMIVLLGPMALTYFMAG